MSFNINDLRGLFNSEMSGSEELGTATPTREPGKWL